MIVASKLTELLANYVHDGILSVILADRDGRILAYSGGSLASARALAAIIDNAWLAYNRHGTPITTENEALKSLWIQNENASHVVLKVSDFLLCLTATPNSNVNVLAKKAEDLASKLSPLVELKNSVNLLP
ncbi:hypothetical protein BC833DRAFT_616451 [Globomyces pollinis-pini]|nr:hypothetical protein BC833DRAFT_616451 [Globomyces pollinis-pini]